MTAVLAPRMRVDNGLSVWRALTGEKVADIPSEELHEVQWRPILAEDCVVEDLAPAEVEEIFSRFAATSSQPSGAKKAYRPPRARSGAGGGLVAQMMKSDVVEERKSLAARPEPKRETADGPARPLFDLQNPKPKETPPPRQNNSHGAKQPCPESGWQYLDPKGNIQGPFSLEKMQKWCSMNVFKPTLKVRCHPEDRFVPLGELFPHPMIPFHSCPKRPV